MGDYYGCAFVVLTVFRHVVKSLTLNPYMSLFNLKLCTHIWSTDVNFRPPYIGLFGLSWSVLSWVNFGGSIGPPTFFCHGQKRDYLSRASQRARGATKNAGLRGCGPAV